MFPRFGILNEEKSGNPDVHHYFDAKNAFKSLPARGLTARFHPIELEATKVILIDPF
jgi:hypothetical protein